MRLLILSFSILPIIILFIPLFSDMLIMGGEGLFTLNYNSFFTKFFSFWFNDGFGHPNVLYSYIGLPHFFFLILEKLTVNIKFINLIYFSILTILPFIGFLLLSFQITKKFILSIAISSFYTFNAFSISYLSSLNITNASSLSAIPFLIFIFNKFYFSKYLYLFFSITSICFSYSFYNPPTFVVIYLSLIFFIPINLFLINQKFTFKKFFIDSLKLSFIFIISNIWWLIPTFISLSDASSLMSKDFAIDWEASTHKYASKVFLDIIFLNHFKYLSSISLFNIYSLTMIGYLFFLVFFFINLNYKQTRNIYLIFVICFLIFFIKGTMPPLGFIYEFLLKNIPFFWVMKSPLEKFSIAFIFYFTLLILFFINDLKFYKINKNYLILIITIFISLPYIFFNERLFLNKATVEGKTYESLRYLKINQNHLDMINFINNLSINGRILMLPQHLNYQSMISLDDNLNVYTGLSYIEENIKSQILRHDHFIYKNFSNDIFSLEKILDKKLLDLFSIEYVLLNKDVVNWYGLIDTINLERHGTLFKNIYEVDNLKLYKVINSKGKISIPSKIISLTNVK